MGEIVWTDKSADNLKSIHDYISTDSIIYASRFIDSIIKETTRLQNYPFSGRIVPELNDPKIREIDFKNYRIVYRVVNDSRVEILVVVHSSRDFENIDIRLLKKILSKAQCQPPLDSFLQSFSIFLAS